MLRNRVVIVDDEVTVRETLTRIVKHENLLPDTYADSRTALEALSEHHDDVMLVIIDIRMPGLSGLELMRRAAADCPDTPFIVTSGDATKKDIIQALKQGALDYFEKPFAVKEISASILKVRLLADENLKTLQVYQSLVEKRLLFKIENDVSLVQSLVSGLVAEIKISCRIPRSQFPGMRMGLHELIVNAIEHGNLELDSELKNRRNYMDILKRRAAQPQFCERRVTVEVIIAANAFSCVISDQGPGFDWHLLPDPTDPENLFKPHGRGVIMAGNFFDEFFFNEFGNQVTVRKFFKDDKIDERQI